MFGLFASILKYFSTPTHSSRETRDRDRTTKKNAQKPKGQLWIEVTHRMRRNGNHMIPFKSDTPPSVDPNNAHAKQNTRAQRAPRSTDCKVVRERAPTRVEMDIGFNVASVWSGGERCHSVDSQTRTNNSLITRRRAEPTVKTMSSVSLYPNRTKYIFAYDRRRSNNHTACGVVVLRNDNVHLSFADYANRSVGIAASKPSRVSI